MTMKAELRRNSKVWPSLKFVYLTTAYFVSQEMIVKLTNE